MSQQNLDPPEQQSRVCSVDARTHADLKHRLPTWSHGSATAEGSSLTEPRTRHNADKTRAPSPSRKVQSVEVLVFLGLILPSLVQSALSGGLGDLKFDVVVPLTILTDFGLLGLILYFLWRNGEPVRCIGWTFGRLKHDLAWGLMMFFPMAFVVNALARALHGIGASLPHRPPSSLVIHGNSDLSLALILVVVVAVVEETIFRGYLLLRLTALTNNTLAAVLLSSIVFALGHGYEGLAGMAGVFVLGFLFAVVYLWRRSLVAPIVAHFLTDFVALALPGLVGK